MLCIYFQATLPCHRHSTLAFQTREGLHQVWAIPRLLSIAFPFSSTASATVLSGHFLPTGVFYLTLLPDIFGTFPTFWCNLLSSNFWWELTVTFLKVAGLHTDLRNTDSAHLFCLIHSNPQSFIHLKHVFMHVLQKLYLCNIAKTFICGEDFDKISSHTVQQPWKYKATAKLISNQNISAYLNCSLKNTFQDISVINWRLNKKNKDYLNLNLNPNLMTLNLNLNLNLMILTLMNLNLNLMTWNLNVILIQCLWI